MNYEACFKQSTRGTPQSSQHEYYQVPWTHHSPERSLSMLTALKAATTRELDELDLSGILK